MEWYEFISQVGFPIAVAVFLLVKMDVSIRQNTRMVEKLLDYIKITARK